jgi:endo-1,4-beta-xylanase
MVCHLAGHGCQMHVLLDWPSIDTIKQSWQRALDVHPDLLLKITELDVRINNPYGNNIPHPGRTDCNQGCTGFQLQAARYKAIIEAYLEVVPPNRRGGITVWGIADNHSWYYQHEGNGISVPDWPLLWNNSLQPKPAFNGVFQALQGN